MLVSRRSGLGKGLSSLIPAGEVADAGDGAILAEVPTVAVAPNPNQPRVHFSEEGLVELAASISEMGVLQPILIRPAPGQEGQYELIAGERRWRAAQRAGLTTIPAIIRLTDDIGSVEQALVENLHRQDLTPLEEAAAFQQLIEDFEMTHDSRWQKSFCNYQHYSFAGFTSRGAEPACRWPAFSGSCTSVAWYTRSSTPRVVGSSSCYRRVDCSFDGAGGS
jgi:hypothetical protein